MERYGRFVCKFMPDRQGHASVEEEVYDAVFNESDKFVTEKKDE